MPELMEKPKQELHIQEGQQPVIEHIQSDTTRTTVRVKVIIYDGVVFDVLADGYANVEIIDIDKDYKDYEALLQYEQELRGDPKLKSQDYHIACFDKD